MKVLALVTLAVLVSACSYHPPTAPEVVVFDAKAPATLSLGTVAGVGSATLTATVQNGHGEALEGVSVAFTADVGTLANPAVRTDAKGHATTTITTAAPAKVLATAGTVTAAATVIPMAPSPTPTPPSTDPPPPPPGPPAPGPLTVTLIVAPGSTGSATSFGIAAPGISRAVWTFGDGASATTTLPNTTHVYAAAGTYTASVTITDTIGRTASDGETFTINDPPPPPGPSYNVSLTASPSSVALNDSATLTASVQASNGAPPPTSFAWDCNGDGTAEVTNGSTSHVCTYTVSGPTTSRVTVTGGSVTGSGSVLVTVAADAPLAVAITAAPSGTLAIGQTVTFTATLSSNGTVPSSGINWEWDDDGDNTVDAVSTSHGNPNSRTTSYGSAKTWTVKVKATDTATGRTAVGTRSVTVQ